MTKPTGTPADQACSRVGEPTARQSVLEPREEELLKLLQALRRDCLALPPSPRRVVLEHAMHVCQSILNNQLGLAWHRRLCEQAQVNNQCLAEQLTLALNLLEICGPSDPHRGGWGPAGQSGSSHDEVTVIRRCWRRLERWLTSSLTDSATQDQVTNRGVGPYSELAAQSSKQPRQSAPAKAVGEEGEPDRRPVAKLDVYCFGAFRIYQDQEPILSWPKGRAKQLLKYLIVNRTAPVPKEVLMDRFWPDLEEGNARNNLNVAVYGLRQSLKREGAKFLHVLFQDGCYLLNPDLDIWVDIEAFDRCLKTAARYESLDQIDAAIEQLSLAEQLYQGDFLAEDLYEEWTSDLRENFRARQLEALRKLSDCQFRRGSYEACVESNRKILAADVADELAHRRLMECFSRMGQRHLALRQYQVCAEVLQKEFGLKPAAETSALFERIKNLHDAIANSQSTASNTPLRLRNA